MLHYGDPEWYEQHVGPFRAAFRMDHKKQASPPLRPPSDPTCLSSLSAF